MTWSQFRDALLHRGPSYNPTPIPEQQYGVVGEPSRNGDIQTGYTYIWGPFRDLDTAEHFAEFVTREIDPAAVMRWDDALGQPHPKLLDPVKELLSWRDACAAWTQASPKET